MVKRFLHGAWAKFVVFICDEDKLFIFMLGLVADIIFCAIVCNGY